MYAYFRWADDLVDAPGRDPAAVAAFVASQRELVAGERLPVGLPEHAFIAACTDPRLGGRLHPFAERMWEALAFDARRGPTPLAPADLDAQLARVGDAYLGAVWVCSGAADEPPADLRELARAATLVHVLRDLEVDRALGYLNHPPEVAPDTLGAWVRARCDEAEARFAAGTRALTTVPRLRTRVLLGIYAWRYRRLIPGLRSGWR